MSDLPNGAAPAAADAGAAPERAPHTEHEIASVLAGLLPDDDDDVEAQDQGDLDAGDGGEELDAGPDESTATGEDEPDEGDEPAEQPAIDAPAGWSGDDQKAWVKLSPEAQQIVRRRESELTGRMTRATQEAAETRTAYTTLQQSADQERSQYVQNLATFRDVLLPGARELEGIDWQRLSAENPAEYIRLSAQRDAMRDRFGRIQGEIQRIQQVQQQETAQRTEKMRQEGRQALIDAVPEFGDEEKGPKLAREIGAWLKSHGYTDQEIASAYDHRAIALAVKAMRLEKAETARQTVQQKRVTKPAPQVQRPGTSPPAQDSKSRRSAQLAERFGQNRSVGNATAIMEDWLRQAGI